MTIHDENHDDEVTDNRVLRSLFAAQALASLRAERLARRIAWNDLPLNEKVTYRRRAEAAIQQERQSS